MESWIIAGSHGPQSSARKLSGCVTLLSLNRDWARDCSQWMPQFLSKHSVLRAVTTSPWTKDFRHLLSFPRHWARRQTRHDPVVKSVAPRDRIKYWNIVPGDQVRLLGDKEGRVREVLSVNKLSNRVFVKGGDAVSSCFISLKLVLNGTLFSVEGCTGCEQA